jgi:TPP-dependent pyruvate/acetoin dehydrogenase alpha subunit
MTAGPGVSARRGAGHRRRAVDGNDVQAVSDAAATQIDEIRAGGGPRLIHAVTYRFKGHVSVDPGTYRDPAEVQAALADDPLLRARARSWRTGPGRGGSTQSSRDAQAEIDPRWPPPSARHRPRPAPPTRTSWTRRCRGVAMNAPIEHRGDRQPRGHRTVQR